MEGWISQVVMTSTPEREPTLSDIAQQLKELRTELDDVKRFQQQTQQSMEQGQQWQERFQQQTQQSMEQGQQWQERFQQQGQQWQDRTWDVVKWVGGISAGLAISASIALVGIVIRQLGQ